MKSIKITLVFFFLPLILTAQDKISFGLNASASSVNKKYVSPSEFPFERQNTFGFSIGSAITVKWSKKIDLCTGLNYRYDKANVTVPILPPLSSNPFKIDIVERFQWIEIPSTINYSFYRNFFVGAGPSLRILLNANSEWIISAPNSTSTNPTETRNITENRNRLVLFYSACVGYKKVIANDKALLIAFGYGSNLTKVMKQDSYVSESALPPMFFNEDYKINHVNLSMTYVFK